MYLLLVFVELLEKAQCRLTGFKLEVQGKGCSNGFGQKKMKGQRSLHMRKVR